MADREKVLKGLECCYESKDDSCPRECPYFSECLTNSHDFLYVVIKNALELLREQPDQKHGHWVFDPDGMDWNIPAWKCSVCACRNDNIPPNLEKTNPLRWSGSKFCPNCGAKMDEVI